MSFKLRERISVIKNP